MNCDNCGKKMGEIVYYTPGINYSCCSVTCLAKMTVNARITTAEKRKLFLDIVDTEWK